MSTRESSRTCPLLPWFGESSGLWGQPGRAGGQSSSQIMVSSEHVTCVLMGSAHAYLSVMTLSENISVTKYSTVTLP